MSNILKKIDAFEYQMLKNLLAQCTKEQKEKFDRMYGSINTISKEKRKWAILQCERTIEINKAKGIT